MSELTINSQIIKANILKLSKYLKRHNIEWSLIVKILGGHREVLSAILDEEVLGGIHSIGDSRILSLKTIKSINPDIRTMFIKPTAINQTENVVRYADISLNTSLDTIEALNKEAKKLGKVHEIIIMIEMGELREGVLRENIINFYNNVFNMQNIEVIGIGTNLGCMYGIQPTYDKLIQLSMLRDIIEVKFGRKVRIVSGGSSITLPLISKRLMPAGCNHLRIGEAAFMGTSPFNGKKFKDLSEEAFEFKSFIIEMKKKDVLPDGIIGEGNIGHTNDAISETRDKIYKAIMDFGLIDVDVKNIEPKKKNLTFVGTSSDMTVYGMEKNEDGLKVGDYIKFKPDYTGVARLMTSKFVLKNII
jgi:predicted amino acid racemase